MNSTLKTAAAGLVAALLRIPVKSATDSGAK